MVVQVNYFHIFQDSSELFCALIGRDGSLVMTAMSTEFPTSPNQTNESPHAWIVDASSFQGWKESSPQFLEPNKALVLASLQNADPSAFSIKRLNVDGWIHLDLSKPALELTKHIVKIISSTTKTRLPTAHHSTVTENGAVLSDITKNDEVNARILNLVAHGLSDKGISSSMCLSTQTVRNRISRMLQDGGFDNRTSLALFFTFVTRKRVNNEIRHFRETPPPVTV